MTRDVFSRARMVGAAIVIAAFALGAAAGVVFANRPRPGVVMTVLASDAIPRELEQLDLSAAQKDGIRAALRAGRPRVMAVMQEMEPRMREALQKTDAEIESVLTPSQAARWREYRREHPPLRQTFK